MHKCEKCGYEKSESPEFEMEPDMLGEDVETESSVLDELVSRLEDSLEERLKAKKPRPALEEDEY